MSLNNYVEVKITFAGEQKEFQCQAIMISVDEAVVLYKLSKDMRVDYLSLPAGTLSLGYFWSTRPYNAYHWITPSGRTLGIYLNISDSTQITPTKVQWRDLIVDVLLTPDDQCIVLDEDELSKDLDIALLRKIKRTRDEILKDHMVIYDEIEHRSSLLLPQEDNRIK